MHNRNTPSAACVFLFLLLLLIPVSPKCWKGTAGECSKAKLVPGFEFAGMGIDIQTLTMTTVYQEISKPGECTLCENPFLKDKPVQRLPLVVTDWTAKILCDANVISSMYHSPISVAEGLTAMQVSNNWKEYLDVKTSPNDKVRWALGGSHSMLTQEAVVKSSEDKYIFFLQHMSCSYYKFHVKKSMLRSGYFQESINLLPEKYNLHSKDEYFQFISIFGTHWVAEFDLGAHVRYLTYISVCEAELVNFDINILRNCMPLGMANPFGLSESSNGLSMQQCKNMMKMYNLQSVGSKMETEGGRYFSRDKEWLENAKSWPGLISASVEPLHTLLDRVDPRWESLRQAVSEYVRQKALWRNCTKPCPPGSQRVNHELCSCQCPNNNFITSKCCAAKRGLGKLTVTIKHAEGLWGDVFSGTDGYVSVSFKGRKMCTDTVWNNNNPTWNAILDFKDINLSENFNNLNVEVWDEDFGWNDDVLGRCILKLEPGISEPLTCTMRRGKLYLKYHLFCGHNLHGPSCWDYSNHWYLTETNLDYHY